jgi:hypothetical protein
VALEIAQAYRHLGSEVTVLARHTLLYREPGWNTLTRLTTRLALSMQIHRSVLVFTLGLDEAYQEITSTSEEVDK